MDAISMRTVSRMKQDRRMGRLATQARGAIAARRANHPNPVHPSYKKYSAFAVGQITSTSSPHPGPKRGAYHDRHERWAGMRWTPQRRARDEIAGLVEVGL